MSFVPSVEFEWVVSNIMSHVLYHKLPAGIIAEPDDEAATLTMSSARISMRQKLGVSVDSDGSTWYPVRTYDLLQLEASRY